MLRRDETWSRFCPSRLAGGTWGGEAIGHLLLFKHYNGSPCASGAVSVFDCHGISGLSLFLHPQKSEVFQFTRFSLWQRL